MIRISTSNGCKGLLMGDSILLAGKDGVVLWPVEDIPGLVAWLRTCEMDWIRLKMEEELGDGEEE